VRIGFDAKRAFLNKSGLGSYSRNLITALSANFPEPEYFLYTTRTNPDLFNLSSPNIRVRVPEAFIHRKMRSYWRSYSVSKQVVKDGIELFHGLSHEIPYHFPVNKVKSVVTIHDLIFLRLPRLYNAIDRYIYRHKFKHACQTANRIIAISKQTASDITEFFGTQPDKIDVVYQGCNPLFYNPLSTDEKKLIRTQYNLPELFLLYVGTIEERKNLLTLVQALHVGKIDIPLVVIGNPTVYMKKIHNFIERHKSVRIIFYDVLNNYVLRDFYQLSDLFVYPSVYEGFGIPVLEALASKTPVITSKGGCFAEAGGPATFYVNPGNSLELADAIKKVLNDTGLRKKMIEEGYHHALGFNQTTVAENVMNIYKKVLQHD
jgi:glycosyltransferase involved in cell wall biosynthesis